MNSESDRVPVHPELLDFFRSMGAEIEGREIRIRAEDSAVSADSARPEPR